MPQLSIATRCSVTHAVGLRPFPAPLLLSSDRCLLRSLPKRLLGLDLSSQGLFLGDSTQETHQSPPTHSKGDGFHQIAGVSPWWTQRRELWVKETGPQPLSQGRETLPHSGLVPPPLRAFMLAKGQQPPSWSYPDVSQRSRHLGGCDEQWSHHSHRHLSDSHLTSSRHWGNRGRR